MVLMVVENVSKKYGEPHYAIKDINFRVNDKEIFMLLGPSGCGKTTMLNILAGFIKPTSGKVWMGDEEIEKPRWKRGVIFQSTDSALFPWLTVKENVEFGLKMRKVDKKEREKIVEKNLKTVGLAEDGNKYPNELSGGMKQRVQIARILANDPYVLLMDEPFANLDAQTRRLMQEELLQIWKNAKKTVVFVTHDVVEAVLLGKRIAVFTSGPNAVIKKIIKVSIPYPRDINSSKFKKIVKRIHNLIIEEVAKLYR